MSKKRGLPKGMTKRGDVYHACFRWEGKLVRKRLSRDFDTANVLLRELMRRQYGMSESEFDAMWANRKHTVSPKYVYFIEAVGLNAVKIGIATDVDKRLRNLQCGCPCELRVFAAYEPMNGAAMAEQLLHQWFSRFRLPWGTEWFEFADSIRDFASDPSHGQLNRVRAESRRAKNELCPT